MKGFALLISIVAFAGCGDDSKAKGADANTHPTDGNGSGSGASDAPKAVDAAHDSAPVTPDAATDVVTVTCPAVPDKEVTIAAGGMAYQPANTQLAVGGIVKFTTQSIHDVFPDATACTGCVADPGIHVDFSKTECKQFTKAAKYGFKCSIHLFKGVIDVQ